jgi:hypothetical protein
MPCSVILTAGWRSFRRRHNKRGALSSIMCQAGLTPDAPSDQLTEGHRSCRPATRPSMATHRSGAETCSTEQIGPATPHLLRGSRSIKLGAVRGGTGEPGQPHR